MQLGSTDTSLLSSSSAEQNLVRLTNEYSDIINQRNNTIVILGEDTNIIYNFFNKTLSAKSHAYGWEFDPQSLQNKETNMNISLSGQEQKNFTICASNYLNNDNSSLQLALNAFFLQRILNTAPTKFVLTIKDIEITDSRSVSNIVSKLNNVLGEFTGLLENVDLNNSNLSIVFTETTKQRSKQHITNIINDALETGGFNDKQKLIIEKLKSSIFLFPKANKQISEYKGLYKILNDTNNSYITPKENNKITVNDSNSQHILDAISIIDTQVKFSIHDLKTEIGLRWYKAKTTIFDITEPTEINKLTGLISILKDYQNIQDRNKSTENFLAVSSKLYSILALSKPENKLEDLINNLKYFANIKLNSSPNSSSEKFQPKAWFDDLFASANKYDINEALISSFKDKIFNDKSSFYNKLNDGIQNFYEKIKTNEILGIHEINNIFKLQEFLEQIKKVTVRNLNDIKTTLMSNSHTLSISHNDDQYKAIDSLKTLLHNSNNPANAKIVWDYIAGCKSIKEIEKNFYTVIYPKLLFCKISPQQEINTYDKLEKLLATAHESVDFNQKEEEFCKLQLADLYCKKAQMTTPSEAIKLYTQAEKLGSKAATIQLGNIELQNNNYLKALEYFYQTTAKTKVSETFEILFKGKKLTIEQELKQGNTQNTVKLFSELTKLCFDQQKFYSENKYIGPARTLQERLKEVYDNSIAAIEEIGGHTNYALLYCLYRNLSEMPYTVNSQLTFLNKATVYEKLHNAFNCTENVIPYNQIYNTSDIYNAFLDYEKPFDILGDHTSSYN